MPCILGPINTVAVSFEKLTDNKGVFIHEVIFWDFEVEGSRAFTDTPRCVVVRTVAGAVVTTEVSHVSNGYTTQMCAHSKQNEPLILLQQHHRAVGHGGTQHQPPFPFRSPQRYDVGQTEACFST